MIAKRGRASYTGERSMGSVDAGAMGVAVIVEHISKAWPEVAGEPAAESPIAVTVRIHKGVS